MEQGSGEVWGKYRTKHEALTAKINLKRSAYDDEIFKSQIPVREQVAKKLEPMVRMAREASKLQAGGTHYKELKIQPTEYCQLNGLNTCESNIVKYATRHKQKGEMLDVEKIIHYALLLAELDYGVAPRELKIIKEILDEI